MKELFGISKNGSDIQTKFVDSNQVEIELDFFTSSMTTYKETYNSYLNHRELPYNIIARNLFRGAVLPYHFIVGSGRQKILMIMGWEEGDSGGYVEREHTTLPWTDSPDDKVLISTGLMSALWPIWKKFLNSPIQVTTVIPKKWQGGFVDRTLRGYRCEVKYSSQYYNLGDDVFNGFSIQGVNKDDYDMLMLAQTKRPTDGKVYDAKEIKKDFSRYLSDDAIIWDWHWPVGHYENFFDGDSTTPNWEYSGMTGEKHKPTYDSVHEFLEALYQDRYLQKTINSATGKIVAARQNWVDDGSNLFLLGVQKIRLYDSDDTKWSDYSSIIDQHTFIKENGIEVALEKHRIQTVKFWKDYTNTILNFYS